MQLKVVQTTDVRRQTSFPLDAVEIVEKFFTNCNY